MKYLSPGEIAKKIHQGKDPFGTYRPVAHAPMFRARKVYLFSGRMKKKRGTPASKPSASAAPAVR